MIMDTRFQDKHQLKELAVVYYRAISKNNDVQTLMESALERGTISPRKMHGACGTV
jgi:hypothetical protein